LQSLEIVEPFADAPEFNAPHFGPPVIPLLATTICGDNFRSIAFFATNVTSASRQRSDAVSPSSSCHLSCHRHSATLPLQHVDGQQEHEGGEEEH